MKIANETILGFPVYITENIPSDAIALVQVDGGKLRDCIYVGGLSEPKTDIETTSG